MSNTEKEINEPVKKGSFLQENTKSLLFIGGAAIVLVLLYVLYTFYLKSRNEEAASKLFKAEQIIGIDSLSNVAINGKNGNLGLAQIADEYANTKSANLANLYLGGIYLRKGEYQKAVDALSKYSATGSVIADPLALCLLGDAYVELKDLEKAVTFYKKAAEKANNKSTSPIFLKKLGLVYENLKDFKSAEETYEKIKSEYPQSAEASMIDTYLERAHAQVK
ncbi:MAG: tetratricopeptide repeat protein [Sphingobacteriaceae bacterium]|nr:tetratricopeptide repeat protein [Sphingobacteriaceae bacterium]